MATKPSVVFKTQTLLERKFIGNHDAPCFVNPGKAFVYSTYNQAEGYARDYSFPVHRLFSKRMTADGAIIDPVGYDFDVVEVRIRIVNPATASATGAIEIDGTAVEGADAIPLDGAAGTLLFVLPDVDGTEAGVAADDISLDVTGDTNGTFVGEVEVVIKPADGTTITVSL
jgi:hypothetical protein